MALSVTERKTVVREWCRAFYANGTAATLTLDDVLAAEQAIETWLVANKAVMAAQLPAAFANAPEMTNRGKMLLFKMVVELL